uniref:Integrator complex subunit 9 n=1 Tax=Anthurium amnicola TaxID=1678845 RepID=A0A1D1XDH8_9ARAE
MKLTCLSKGRGFHFPPCYMLDLCGFRILLECPVDLSALMVFTPISTPTSAFVGIRDEGKVTCEVGSSPKRRRWTEEKEEEGMEVPLSKSDLINALPWYKTVGSLHLWDVSLIDVVVVSSPMGMLGLPFLTQNNNFSAKIYATEVTARIGQLMMEDLVSMHNEALQCYGPEEEIGCPEWMKWTELERLPQVIRKIVMGKTGAELGSWLPLYNLADIDECMKKVETVKYAEQSCYNSTLILKASSSGLDLGAANWTLLCPGRSITYLSSSVLGSANAMEFNYHCLQGNDVILFSDFSSLLSIPDFSNDADVNHSGRELVDKDPSVSNVPMIREDYNNNEEASKYFIGNIDMSEEEMDKINFICSCVMDTVKREGSVLIPIGRLGIILELLEKISWFLESSELKVPIYMISSTADEILAFTNVVPEWLCNERQEKLYSGLPLFGHEKLIKEKRLQIFPVIQSSNLIETWKEPCIVFSPHWSLRLGPTIHLLRRWHADDRCLLILEQGFDADVALLPFMPVAIKVLQCSFLSGIGIHKVQPLLEFLKPKLVLFPEDLGAYIQHVKKATESFLYYSENRTLSVPRLSDDLEAWLSLDSAHQQEALAISRFKGKLHVRDGKYLLVPVNGLVDLSYKQMQWGFMDPNMLFLSLEKKGIKGSFTNVKNMSDDVYRILVNEPNRAVIELSSNQIVITASDERLAGLILEVFQQCF